MLQVEATKTGQTTNNVEKTRSVCSFFVIMQ